MKITLPKWVYRCLADFGNCALPNACLQMDEKALIKHLESKMGCKIRLRRAKFDMNGCDLTIRTGVKIQEYIIAEEDYGVQ